MNLSTWALRWHVSPAALADLVAVLDQSEPPEADAPPRSEAAAQNLVRLEASRKGMRLWRNNVGAGEIDGQWLRWGLANDSPQVNKILKSADLIGIRPVVITPAHVGHTLGQFVSREMKAPGWRMPARPSARETAQQNWAALISSLGGDAAFCTGEGTL